MSTNVKKFSAAIAATSVFSVAVAAPIANAQQEDIELSDAEVDEIINTPIEGLGYTPQEIHDAIVYAAEVDPEARRIIAELEAQILDTQLVESETGEYYINEAVITEIAAIGSIVGPAIAAAAPAVTGALASGGVGAAVSAIGAAAPGVISSVAPAVTPIAADLGKKVATKVGGKLLSSGKVGDVLGSITGGIGGAMGKDKKSTSTPSPSATTSAAAPKKSSTPATTSKKSTPTTKSSAPAKPTTSPSKPASSAKQTSAKSTAKETQTRSAQPKTDQENDQKPGVSPKAAGEKDTPSKPSKAAENNGANPAEKGEKTGFDNLPDTAAAKSAVSRAHKAVSRASEVVPSLPTAAKLSMASVSDRLLGDIERVQAAMESGSQSAIDAAVEALSDSTDEFERVLASLETAEGGKEETTRRADNLKGASPSEDAASTAGGENGEDLTSSPDTHEGEKGAADDLRGEKETQTRSMLASTGAPVGAVASVVAGLVAVTGVASYSRRKN